MCGRYTTSTEEELIEIKKILEEIAIKISDEEKQYLGKEAYPSSFAPVILNNGEIKIKKWGLEKWDKKGVIFNARSESLQTSNIFSSLLFKGRCIIPASNYFEWLHENGKIKDKYQIYDKNSPMFLAGLINKNDEFTIVTKEVSKNIAYIHNRMPLLFTPLQAKEWLFGNFNSSLLKANNVIVDSRKE